jgi:hypothetical protein
MPWKVTELMTEKERFAVLAPTGRFTVGELCQDFGICRKTGHKYSDRLRERGLGRTERTKPVPEELSKP